MMDEIERNVVYDQNTNILERTNDQELCGFVTAFILPPSDGHNAILPYFSVNIGSREKPNPMFSLCRKCAETQQKSPCLHNDDEREFAITTTIRSLNYGYENTFIRLPKLFLQCTLE